jgi:hypothetical protein
MEDNMTTRFLPDKNPGRRGLEYRRAAKELARAYYRALNGCARENDNKTIKVLLKTLKAGAKDAIELNSQVLKIEPVEIALVVQKHEPDDQSTQ